MPMMPSSPPARRACPATSASAWPPAPPPFSACRSSRDARKLCRRPPAFGGKPLR
jgi:hypothetical protein